MSKNYTLTTLIVVLLSLFYSVGFCQNWVQLGDDIYGNEEIDKFGFAVSLSNDGLTLAVGSPWYSNFEGSGYVQVYRWISDSGRSGSGGEWLQIGNDIINGWSNGWSISLSGDGLTLAVGEYYSDTIRIYRWNGVSWILEGVETQSGPQSRLGWSISLSSSGNYLAAGAPGFSSLDNDNGYVRVYSWNGQEWSQLGNDISGEADGDESGDSVSISSDGQTVAIGAPRNNGNFGHVRIYRWNGVAWTQLGNDIDGEEIINSNHGDSVSLSSDGETVAIGAPGGSGRVSVYNWDGVAWTLLGSVIDEEGGRRIGNSVSLSSEGETLAVGMCGSTCDDWNNIDSSYVRVYHWDGESWMPIGNGIYGEGQDHSWNRFISLSSDGETLAIGDPGFYGNENNSGVAQVYSTFLGCTNATACNFNPIALVDNGSCQLSGCTDSSACNYDDEAECDNGTCTWLDECGICGGPGSIYECGCSDIPDGDCDCDGNTLDVLGICGGNCVSDSDNDGICDNEDPCIGVIDECGVCNGPGAIYQCGCSDIPEGHCDCDGNSFSPVVWECNCDEALTNLIEEIITDYDDCTITETCYCECINDVDQDGVCDELEWSGCQDQSACNYSPNSTDADNSICIYPGSDCDDLNPLTFLDYVNDDCFCGGFEVTGIDESSTTSISVYPNPCSSSFTINTDGKPQYSNYRIYDMTGKEVHSGFVGSGITNIEINTLASGIYSLVILSKDGDTFRQSLVVQREE